MTDSRPGLKRKSVVWASGEMVYALVAGIENDTYHFLSAREEAFVR